MGTAVRRVLVLLLWAVLACEAATAATAATAGESTFDPYAFDGASWYGSVTTTMTSRTDDGEIVTDETAVTNYAVPRGTPQDASGLFASVTEVDYHSVSGCLTISGQGEGQGASGVRVTAPRDTQNLTGLEIDVDSPSVMAMWDYCGSAEPALTGYSTHGSAVLRPVREATGWRITGTSTAVFRQGFTDARTVYEVNLRCDDPCTANRPPQATIDRATTLVDTTVDIPVLANDSDPDGDDIAVQSCTVPRGAAVVAVGPAARVTPPTGWRGVLRFRCTIADNAGLTATAPVLLRVGGSVIVDVEIDYHTYWYDERPGGRRGSDMFVAKGRDLVSVRGSAKSAVQQVCMTGEWRAAVSSNLNTVPALWWVDGRDVNGTPDPVWEQPQQASGGFLSVLRASSQQCVPPGQLSLAWNPSFVARTPQLGPSSNFTALGHYATARLQLTDGRWLECSVNEDESAPKRTPISKDLDERERCEWQF